MTESGSQSESVDILNKLFSLPDLVELPDPPAVSMWPQTVGWYWLAFFMLAGIVVSGFLQYRKWHEDLWRREALAELDHIQQSSHVKQLPTLIKRVLLMHLPRTEVNRYSGPDWQEELNILNASMGIKNPSVDFAGKAGHLLSDIAYRPENELSKEHNLMVCSLIRQWIRELPHV